MDIEKAYEIILDKLHIWLSKLIAILPNLLLASVIIVVGLLISRLLRNLVAKGINKIVPHKSLANLITSVFYIFFISISIFAALSVLKLDKTVTTLLAGAGILGLAFAFAFQDFAANFISGIFLAVQRPFTVGQIIKSKDIIGAVQIVNLRDTIIKTFQGQIVRIPNKDIFQNPIVNYTTLGKRRLDLEVGVSYGDNLSKVKEVALEAVKKVSVLDLEEEPKLFFKAFGDSSITFDLQLWFNAGDQPVYLKGRSEAIELIKTAFDANDISIPFPIRTLDFGIKGGEKLSEIYKNG